MQDNKDCSPHAIRVVNLYLDDNEGSDLPLVNIPSMRVVCKVDEGDLPTIVLHVVSAHEEQRMRCLKRMERKIGEFLADRGEERWPIRTKGE